MLGVESRPSLGMGNRHSRKEKRVQEERRRAEEDEIATEALKHITDLPEELKIYILHFFTPRSLLQLQLPTDMLRVVLQAREAVGTVELGRRSWRHRLGLSAHGSGNQGEVAALAALAASTGLMPLCPVVRSTIVPHTCKPFCSWFPPHKVYVAYTFSDEFNELAVFVD